MRYIITLTIFALLFLSGCQKKAATNVSTKSAANVNQKSLDPSENAPRISLEDAKQEFDAGTAIFVDTRAEVQFQQEHVKGAINLPAEAMALRYKEIPTGKKIIAYCS
jgi:PBP1b-binding outer membrane lipoprotein LpoB